MIIKKIRKSLIKKYKILKCFLFNGSKILVLSDSHGGVFEYIYDNNLLEPHLINVEIVGGATAYGLSKEYSQTNSFSKYKYGLKRFHHYDTIMIQLGEVDASFILWKKIKDENIDFNEAIELSLNGYKKLLNYVMKIKGKKIIITGAILPTLNDNQKADESAILRNTIQVTQKERTNLILQYNQELFKLAKKYNLDYIDITEETYDKNSGVIKKTYTRKEKIDHHQSFERTSLLWVKKLKQIL